MDVVSLTEQVDWGRIPGKRANILLYCPAGGGLPGDSALTFSSSRAVGRQRSLSTVPRYEPIRSVVACEI
jgi:hypothetical protein